MAKLAPREFRSKKGKVLSFKTIESSDTDQMISMMQQIAVESQNTNQVPNRNYLTPEERKKQIERMNEHPADLTLGVFFEEKLIGSLFFYTPDFTHPWKKHLGAFGMMILQDFWGEGIGKELLRLMEEHAQSLGISRIEARVRTFNDRGLHLYKSMGYKIEGTHKNAALIDGKSADEYSIAKLINEKFPKWTPPTLETERLILRAITLEDAPAMFQYAQNKNMTKYVMWEPHQSIQDTIKGIHEYFFPKYNHQEPEAFAITLKSNPSLIIGTCGARWESKLHQCMELGATLAEEFWGKGIMTEAQSEVIRYCFEEYSAEVSPVNRIQGHCKAENIGSEKMILKTGRVYEATHRERVFNKNRFWDMKVFAILKSDWLKARKSK